MYNKGNEKGGWCTVLPTLPPSCAKYLEIWQPQPPGTLWARTRPVQGLLYLTLSVRIITHENKFHISSLWGLNHLLKTHCGSLGLSCLVLEAEEMNGNRAAEFSPKWQFAIGWCHDCYL